MPTIRQNGDEWCLEGYGDADKCYDSEEAAQAAAEKLNADKALDDVPRWKGMDGAGIRPGYVSHAKADEEAIVEEEAPPAEPEAEAAEATVDVPSGIRRLVLNIGTVVEKALGRKASDEATGFKVAGNHWLAVYSNNFKDRDGELFPVMAIDAYVQRVDIGMVPPPELWVWHAGKNVAIGAADWVARHGHFTLAAGQFYGGEAARTAKAYYARHAKDTGISHGFTFPETDFDGKSYNSFNTFEVSLLPRGAEANWFTSLEGIKAMALDDKKLQYLKEVFGEEHAARILSDWDKRGKALEDLNVEFKDFAGTPDREEGSAVKAAADAAQKSFGDLLGEVLATSSEPVTAALEAVKAAKAVQADNAVMRAEIDALRTEMELRPRIASRDDAMALDTTQGKGKELLDTVHQQMVERDPFWGTEGIKAP